MLIIAITQPMPIDREVVAIRRLLANSADVVHLRKPDASIDYCRELLAELTPMERARIVVHDHFALYEEFSLRGVHLNKNVSCYPTCYTGTRTRSCHTFEEVVRYKASCDYLFLSPIFDSISKVGYHSNFNHGELQQAADDGIIDNKVIALGGVTPDKFSYLESLHFGGAAMLGAARFNEDEKDI